MAFNIAGLGGTFAAGMLGGMNSAQKEREALVRSREQEQLQTYLALVKSGKWEPVDMNKGVPEGGVLRVGGIGYLTQAKEQPDTLELAKLANYRSMIEARRPREGEEKAYPDVIEVEKDGEQVRIPAHRVYKWNGEQWVQDRVVPKNAPTERSIVTYRTPDGGVEYVPSNKKPSVPGSVPVPTFLSGERLELSSNISRADQLDNEARQHAGKVAKLEQMVLPMADEPEDDPMVKRYRDEYKDAYVAGQVAAAKAQAIRDGKSPNEVEDIGNMAYQVATEKMRQKFMPAVPEEPGWAEEALSAGYEWLKDTGRKVGKEVAEGVEAIRQELARRAQEKAKTEKRPYAVGRQEQAPKVRKKIVQEKKPQPRTKPMRKPRTMNPRPTKQGTIEHF